MFQCKESDCGTAELHGLIWSPDRIYGISVILMRTFNRRRSTGSLTSLWSCGEQPQWAASKIQPTDVAWLGPGSTSSPKNLQDRRDYVTTVVSRHKGVITAYEVGNEPNVKAFWTGTDAQLVELVKEAAQIVHATYSSVLVVAPTPVVFKISPQQTLLANKFWESMNIQRNGDPLPASQQVDALSFHWYPTSQTKPIQLKTVVKQLRAQAREAGYVNTPLWTEVNFYGHVLTPDAQKQKVIRTNKWIKVFKLPRLLLVRVDRFGLGGVHAVRSWFTRCSRFGRVARPVNLDRVSVLMGAVPKRMLKVRN